MYKARYTFSLDKGSTWCLVDPFVFEPIFGSDFALFLDEPSLDFWLLFLLNGIHNTGSYLECVNFFYEAIKRENKKLETNSFCGCEIKL